MSWFGSSDDRSSGRRKRGRRGPRWVTDRAREVAESQPPVPPPSPPPSGRLPRRPPAPRYEEPEYDRPRYDAPRYEDGQRYHDDRRRRDERAYDGEPRAATGGHRGWSGEPRGGYDEPWHEPPRPRRSDDPHRAGAAPYPAEEPPIHARPHADRRWVPPPAEPTRRWQAAPESPRARRDPDHEPGYGERRSRRWDDEETDAYDHVPERPTRAHEPADTRGRDGGHAGGRGAGDQASTGPRKLTVTRVAAWRSRQLTQQGIAAFRRAATADGADRSGLTALTFPVMASFAADAAVAVALANTLFFSAATAESKTKVALYLLITVAPFALLAPVIGPLLDRLQRGRRVAMAASFVGRAVLAMVMAQHFDDWLLYPAALGSMVLTRSFGVLKAAVTPRVLPSEITLTKTNSRLAVFGLAAGGGVGAVAAGFAWAFGSAGALWFTAVVCVVGAWLCLRIPAWVEVTEGEVPASLRATSDGGEGRRRREPLGHHVVVALWGNGTIRILTGFLTLFVAFVVKGQTEQSPWQQLVLLGMVGAAAGAGNVAGNALGARQHFDKPDQVILTCVGIVFGAAVLAALIDGIGTAVLVGLVGSTCSSLAKACQDAVIQRDMSEESRASAFGWTETVLQLSWTFGGALGVLLPPTYWIGFTVVSGLLLVGTIQTAMVRNGRSLIPPLGRPSLGRLRPKRPGASRQRSGQPGQDQPHHDRGRQRTDGPQAGRTRPPRTAETTVPAPHPQPPTVRQWDRP